MEANAPLEARGNMAEIPAPDYGYVRGRLLLRERIDYDQCNDWVNGNLDELTYEDRHRVMATGRRSFPDCNRARVDIARGIHEE